MPAVGAAVTTSRFSFGDVLLLPFPLTDQSGMTGQRAEATGKTWPREPLLSFDQKSQLTEPRFAV